MYQNVLEMTAKCDCMTYVRYQVGVLTLNKNIYRLEIGHKIGL